MRFKISLLHGKIFFEALHLFLLASMSLLTLLIISRAVKMREVLIGLDIGLLDILQLFGYMIPMFLLLVIPVACMLSVFLLFLRMGTDRELIALKAGGVSILQMLPAPALLSAICFCMTLVVSLYLIAWGMAKFQSTLLDIAANSARIEVRPGVFNTDFPKLTIYARKVDQDQTLRDVIVNDASRPERKMILLAPRGTITADHAINAVKFVLNDGKLYSIASEKTSVMGYKVYTVTIPLEQIIKDIRVQKNRPQEMEYSKLLMESNKLQHEAKLHKKKDQHYETLIRRANKFVLEWHKRWTYPVACIVLALFVIPLAVASQGVHRQVGMLLTLFMFFVYYSLMSMASILAEEDVLPPALVMWLPNIIFFIIAVLGMRMAYKERIPNIGGMIIYIKNMANSILQKTRKHKNLQNFFKKPKI